MIKKFFIKNIIFILLFLYLIVNQFFSISQESKMVILPILIFVSIGTLIFRSSKGSSLKTKQLLMLSASILVTFAIYFYYIKINI
jgi:hypothetical protein